MHLSLTTVLHERVSNSIVVPFKNWAGAEATEYCFLLASVGLLVGLFFLVRRCVPRGLAAVLRGFVLLAAAWLGVSVLMVTKIEMAHYPQYILLSVFLRLGGFSPSAAFLAGTCGSIIDEGRQYLLHPRFTGYFDFNDLVINAVGLAIGLWLVQGRGCNAALSRAACRVSMAFLALWAVALLGGLALGCIQCYVPLPPGSAPTAFPSISGAMVPAWWGGEAMQVLALSLKASPTAFWQPGPFGPFHVMGVGEGMALFPLSSAMLFFLCRQRGR